MTVVDGLDRKVTLPRVPARIVSLAPKNTELLFAIGAGERVVGVTNYCNFPPEARSRKRIGGFSSKSQSLEKIVALKPDLVVAAGELQWPSITELERLGVPVASLGAESLAGLYRELDLLGRLTGHEDDAAPPDQCHEAQGRARGGDGPNDQARAASHSLLSRLVGTAHGRWRRFVYR